MELLYHGEGSNNPARWHMLSNKILSITCPQVRYRESSWSKFCRTLPRFPLPWNPPLTDQSYLAAISSLFWRLSHSLVGSEGEFSVLAVSKLSLTCIQGSKMWYCPGLCYLCLLLTRLVINTESYNGLPPFYLLARGIHRLLTYYKLSPIFLATLESFTVKICCWRYHILKS